MLIVCISDSHSRHRELPTLPDGDVLIHAGDWTINGGLPETIDFLQWFGSQPHTHKLLIAGNHDRLCEEQPHLFKDLLPEGVNYLQDCGVAIDGVKFWGTPVTPEFGDWAFNRSNAALIAHYDLIPADTQVLISHGPPLGILDRLASDGNYAGLVKDPHVGSHELLNKIESLLELKLVVMGHIHNAYGTLQIKDKMYINAAQLNEKYQVQNSPIVYEI
jgi:Icc-related predicted phosphoesterase